MTHRSLLAVAVALVSLSCGAKQLPYTPSSSMAPAEAREVLLRALEAQPHPYAPSEVTVTPEKLDVLMSQLRRSVWTGGVTTVPERTVVYFSDIGKTDLSRSDPYYIVRLWDSGGIFRLRVFCSSKGKAEAVSDALASLRKQHAH